MQIGCSSRLSSLIAICQPACHDRKNMPHVLQQDCQPGLAPEMFDLYLNNERNDPTEDDKDAIYECSGYAHACELLPDPFQSHIITVSKFLDQYNAKD